MDNPISWGILCAVVFYLFYRILLCAISELEANHATSEREWERMGM